MVRRIGGPIFKSVPATAEGLQNRKEGNGAGPPSKSNSSPISAVPNNLPIHPASPARKTIGKGSLPTIYSPSTARHGLPSRRKPAISAPILSSGFDAQDVPKGGATTTDLVMLGAKPSEFRAALKGERLRLQKDKQRQEQIRQRETAAAVRMKRIKDEINAIKANESGLDVDQNKGSFDPRKPPHFSRSFGPSSPRPKTAAPLEVTSRGTKNLAMEELLAERRAKIAEAEKKEREEEELRAKTHREMMNIRTSFSKEEPQQKKRASARLSISTQVAALSIPPRRTELAHTPTGKLEKTTSHRALSRGLGRRGVARTPSNLVPEMRRRANQRDLLFVDANKDDVIGDNACIDQITDTESDTSDDEDFSFENLKMKVHGAAKESMDNMAKAQEKENATTISAKSEVEKNMSDKEDEAVPSKPKKKKKKKVTAKKNKPKKKKDKNDQKKSSEGGKGSSSSGSSRRANESAETKKTNIKVQVQKSELDQAKEDFDRGYFLCWNCGDSANAIVEYRKALFTRESLLGKYHEETGRSYFWIGKSLAKLKEYDEALMAYSRATRIFQRVLKKDNKYNIWALTSLETLIRQMDDPDVDFETYKFNLESSIMLEQEGDQLRKKGNMAEAITKYREGIENLDAYHPDVADLYCKIAIIMRQQGEFDRALEEYRYASEIYELSLGSEHPETVNTLNQLITKKRLNQKSMALMEKLKLKPPS